MTPTERTGGQENSSGGEWTRNAESELRQINEALVVSSIRQHELAEVARLAAEAARLSEERYRESERKLRMVMESVPQMMFTTNSIGEVNYANGKWLAYSGGLFDQIEGFRWRQLIHPSNEAEQLRLWELAINTGQPYEMEYRLRGSDGGYRWHLCRALPMVNPDGLVDSWIGSNTDIHFQKELEQDLEIRVRDRTADLEEALRELEGFSYTVAHDLRAPLRAIIFASKFLLQEETKNLNADQLELLVSQAANAQKLAKLVDDLLHFSRLHRLPIVRTPVDLTALVEGVFQDENQEGSRHPCTFGVEERLTCNADPGLLRLVMVNLIQNACKFSPEGGTVFVGKSFEDGQESFFVKDQGIGLDLAYADKIFQPFERLHRTDEYPGTGIGLASVKRIIERHGGRVWVDSILGEGTTIHFTLGDGAPG